jgi:peptidoglycan/xylan/chitin deacetylase (PgdA/CDA1 family)
MSNADSAYPRDMVGYGRRPPARELPGGARMAVQFVVNYEEGGENCVLHGDPASETFLSEIIGAQAFADRHMSMESIYEYGSRAGFWRLQRLFTERSVPVTVFGVTRPWRVTARRRRDARGGLGDRLPRPALDQLPGGPRGGGTRAHAARHRLAYGADR